MKSLSVLALSALFSLSSLACNTYEAQFVASITKVETDSMTYCKAFISAETVSHYNTHALCPLELSEVLENGIDFPLVHGHDCELTVGEGISGILMTTPTGIVLD